MKKSLFILFFICISTKFFAQNKDYDAVLAQKLGADDYGMKKYVLVLLRNGSNPSKDKAVRGAAFSGHMKNMNRLANENKLILAGPIGKDEKYAGIFVFNCETIEEAKLLTETDPAIKEKFLVPDFYQWYGSAAVQEVSNIHKKLETKSF